MYEENENENENEILIAAENNDYAVVEHLLKSGVSANTSNELGLTALHIAVSKGNVKIIDLLISYHADVNASCSDGWSVLCEATKYNQLHAIETLLSHGAKADTPKKWTVYETALRANANIKIFEMLLAILITPEADNNEITKIFEKAIRRDRHDVLDVIISICPSFSTYLDSQPKSQRIVRLELPVLVDLENSDEMLNAVLVNGYKYEKLFKGGPFDITEEFVEIYHNSELIFRTVQHCNYYYPQPLLNIRKSLWGAGYYPRLAVLNPKLEITGLSHETGGWINATAYRYLDECPSYKWFSIESSLNILPCIDSYEMA